MERRERKASRSQGTKVGVEGEAFVVSVVCTEGEGEMARMVGWLTSSSRGFLMSEMEAMGEAAAAWEEVGRAGGALFDRSFSHLRLVEYSILVFRR